MKAPASAPTEPPTSPYDLTIYIHQNTPCLCNNDCPSSNVPAVDSNLKEGFNCSRCHQAHVGGCCARSTQPEKGEGQVMMRERYWWGIDRVQDPINHVSLAYPWTGMHRIFCIVEKILLTVSVSLLEPSSLMIMDLSISTTKHKMTPAIWVNVVYTSPHIDWIYAHMIAGNSKPKVIRVGMQVLYLHLHEMSLIK